MRQPFPEGLLKVGDVVRIEIEGIGELRNTVVEEPEGYLAPDDRGRGGMGALTDELRAFLDAQSGRRAGDRSPRTAGRASRSSTSRATATAC